MTYLVKILARFQIVHSGKSKKECIYVVQKNLI
jgi:hypothetical protein